jgi:hypothetical protein
LAFDHRDWREIRMTRRSGFFGIVDHLDASTNLLLPAAVGVEERLQEGSGVGAMADRW